MRRSRNSGESRHPRFFFFSFSLPFVLVEIKRQVPTQMHMYFKIIIWGMGTYITHLNFIYWMCLLLAVRSNSVSTHFFFFHKLMHVYIFLIWKRTVAPGLLQILCFYAVTRFMISTDVKLKIILVNEPLARRISVNYHPSWTGNRFVFF